MAVHFTGPLMVDGVEITSGGGGGGDVAITLELDDISTLSSAYAVAPFAGTVNKIYSVIYGSIATADAFLTPRINAFAMTSGTITVANSGSGAGDIDSSTPSANNTIAAGDLLEVITNGASTNTVRATITMVITPS
jgi:hypothetical protein